MMTCTLFSFLVDCLYTRNFRKSCENIKSFFSGMGRVFASTVSLIICAGVFADGLKATGGITTIINAAASMEGTGGMIMLLVMCGIMILASFVTGSGNAAFFAFSSLLPTAAKSVGWDILVMACPVQLVAGIARSMCSNCRRYDFRRKNCECFALCSGSKNNSSNDCWHNGFQ